MTTKQKDAALVRLVRRNGKLLLDVCTRAHERTLFITGSDGLAPEYKQEWYRKSQRFLKLRTSLERLLK